MIRGATSGMTWGDKVALACAYAAASSALAFALGWWLGRG